MIVAEAQVAARQTRGAYRGAVALHGVRATDLTTDQARRAARKTTFQTVLCLFVAQRAPCAFTLFYWRLPNAPRAFMVMSGAAPERI